MSRRPADSLSKFILPMGEQPYMETVTTGKLPKLNSITNNRRRSNFGVVAINGYDQIPPIDRGELPAFQTNARGGPNVLVPPGTLGAATSGAAESAGHKTALDAVWRKGLFASAVEIPNIPPHVLHEKSADGKLTKIVRYVPERFENGKVRPPHMTVEQVPVEAVEGTGEVLMSPQKRREYHEAAVNARVGAQALMDAYRAKTKLERTCRMNYPHGSLGVQESPYGASNSVYTNAEQLQAEYRAAARKGRGGQAPAGTIGNLLSTMDGSGAAEGVHRGKAKGLFHQKGTFNISKMV